MSNLRSGNSIKVRAYGDTVLTRRCVDVQGETVFVCNETEYEAAMRENRQPICIGFPIMDVVEVESESETENEQ